MIFKLLIGVIGVFVLSQYLDRTVMIIVSVTVLVLFISYNVVYKMNKDIYLEGTCEVDKYIEYVEKSYKDKDETLYRLHKAYALYYLGKESESRDLLQQIDYSSIQKDKHKFIHRTLQLKFLYLDNNIELYEDKMIELHNSKLLQKLQIRKEVYEVPLLLMKKDYETARELLMNIIPTLRKRFIIFELEYYLVLCHIQYRSYDDAKAVLEFVSSKELEFTYIYKCRKLLEEIK